MPVEELRVGDLFVVRPGEKVATDGVVVEGSSAVDTAIVTGESVPVEVGPDDEVIGATINVGGRLVVRATRVGEETALAQIARLVEEAQTGKAPVQRLADRVAGVFVPIVIALAVATLGFWLGTGSDAGFAFAAAVAVLIIACPCALGLATPTALLVGTGRGAQLGVLIRGPEVLESTRRVDTIVLDKTGTVTTGQGLAHRGRAGRRRRPGRGAADRRRGGARGGAPDRPGDRRGRGRTSRAPPGRRVVRRHGRSRRARGGRGRDRGVGRPSLLGADGIELPPELERARVEAEAQGRTAVAVARDGRAIAVLVVADTLKPTSAQAIAELRGLQLRPVLLTGDNEATARAVAAQVGDRRRDRRGAARATRRPSCARLQDEGSVVAMVGDGVNDAAGACQAPTSASRSAPAPTSRSRRPT